jgi:hypothetical protein
MKIKIAFKPATGAYTKEKYRNHTRTREREEKKRTKQ